MSLLAKSQVSDLELLKFVLKYHFTRLLRLFMKQIFRLGLFCLFLSAAFAGFSDSRSSAISVKDALQKSDDARVIIEGNFISQIDEDEYIFRDGSGEIVVEVDSKAWAGVDVTPDNRVRIQGKIDKEFGKKAKIDVFRVTKIK